MSKLDCQPQVATQGVGEEAFAVPAAISTTPSRLGTRSGPGARSLRRRINGLRVQVEDDGFRLFRVY